MTGSEAKRFSGSRAAAIFCAPAVIALSTVAGLLMALFGDGIWDAIAWFLLAAPLFLAAWCWKPSGRPPLSSAGKRR